MKFELYYVDEIRGKTFYQYKYEDAAGDCMMRSGMIRIEDQVMSIVPRKILWNINFKPDDEYIAMVAADAIASKNIRIVPPFLRTANRTIKLEAGDTKETILLRIWPKM